MVKAVYDELEYRMPESDKSCIDDMLFQDYGIQYDHIDNFEQSLNDSELWNSAPARLVYTPLETVYLKSYWPEFDEQMICFTNALYQAQNDTYRRQSNQLSRRASLLYLFMEQAIEHLRFLWFFAGDLSERLADELEKHLEKITADAPVAVQNGEYYGFGPWITSVWFPLHLKFYRQQLVKREGEVAAKKQDERRSVAMRPPGLNDLSCGP